MKPSYARTPLCLLTVLALACPVAGCAPTITAQDLMEGRTPSEQPRKTASFAPAPSDLPESQIEPEAPPAPDPSNEPDPQQDPADPQEARANALANFSVRLFQQCDPATESMLVSPTSVLCALGMAANGAGGTTLAQMEDVFSIPVGELNAYAHDLMAGLPANDDCRMTLANSLWLKDADDFVVEPAFLQANADWYDAGAFRAPFDGSTVSDINTWTSQHTDGMIPTIVNDIPPEAVMYLVNALAFDARWLDEYEDTQVWDDPFTAEDGTRRTVGFMHSQEYGYLEDEGAVGFTKPYQNSRYSFAALLPSEGTSVADYAASLTGERLRAVLQNASSEPVDVALPKFESDYSTSLNNALIALGMADAFNPDLAAFSGIGTSSQGNLFIGGAVHKTHISVDEHGTKAAAVTAIRMDAGAAMAPEEPKSVRLDRPFVYLIVDCDQNLPVFIGTVMDVEG